MSKIKIGADELILWLRKNNIATEIPNDEINGLGQIIYRIIDKLGGQKIADNQESLWPNSIGDKNIGKYSLPKTSAQYSMEIDKLPKLYEELAKLK